jgi:hypothetical protein
VIGKKLYVDVRDAYLADLRATDAAQALPAAVQLTVNYSFLEIQHHFCSLVTTHTVTDLLKDIALA